MSSLAQRSDAEAEKYPYHKSVHGKYRTFKLLKLGSTPETCRLRCELCKRTVQAEDPLYAGYEVEWAYYSSDGKQEGYVCHYSAIAHRLRYKSYTRSELSKELRESDEAYEEFMVIEGIIISQKRRGILHVDMCGPQWRGRGVMTQ